MLDNSEVFLPCKSGGGFFVFPFCLFDEGVRIPSGNEAFVFFF